MKIQNELLFFTLIFPSIFTTLLINGSLPDVYFSLKQSSIFIIFGESIIISPLRG
ncbi:hypothetical protein KSU1_C0481 [Candidatus Jettenia caeni]|uniref:Uncharacterized protein n=1 Tax=Candidatus Jettenia caeni TaxID=247490 RepID=I3IK32_9BACT|nr:hypothetical protein KSU1_C0481 [Candidatus Jettenia caeni]